MPHRAPVLLLGAGTGEATCGILYLASYLRRHGVEAVVQLSQTDDEPAAVERSLERLLRHVRPRLVGISLKWFHHLGRALFLARAVKTLAPDAEVVLGGNSASLWWEELVEEPGVDCVALGDGEAPLLALARGDAAPPNVVRHGAKKPTLTYVQSAKSDDVYYSHFAELFLSQEDLHSFSGWVQPGKGCGENCLYCSGTRGLQQATFGRARPFLRPREAVRRDHQAISPYTWQLRYDFAGSTKELLEEVWRGVDWSRHAATYFLWGVPPPGLAEALARNFQRVYMVVDIGCFSQGQRLATMQRGLLKPCPTDRELLARIEQCRAFENLELEISGIAGLPFATEKTLAEERRLVKEVLSLGCAVGYQRLECQPGALATEHPERFGMAAEARSYGDFKRFFERRAPGDPTVPMIRFEEPKLEAAVQRTSEALDALIWDAAARRDRVALRGSTRLANVSAAVETWDLGAWLGPHRVPPALRREPVTAVRSSDGTGLACAPSVQPKRFADPALQQGAEGAALLEVLAAFDAPAPLDLALRQLATRKKLDPAHARSLVEQLVAAHFLRPAPRR